MAEKAEVSYPRRGDIYLVSFDPTLEAEIGRSRPALVIQNDIANRYSPIVIMAALSSRFQEPLYPTEVLVRAPEGGLSTESVVLLNQIRSLDKQKLIKRQGALRPPTMAQVERALQISLGMLRL